MFGIGAAEFAVLMVVGLLVFGPDRLPDFARQAGRMVRQVRQFSQQARDDIRSELGPDYADFELTDLDPRRALRKHIFEAWDDDADAPGAQAGSRVGEKVRGATGSAAPGAGAAAATPAPTLAPGELPPYDPDAT